MNLNLTVTSGRVHDDEQNKTNQITDELLSRKRNQIIAKNQDATNSSSNTVNLDICLKDPRGTNGTKIQCQQNIYYDRL